MTYKTQADKLKYIRAYCKARNATFKRSNCYINNKSAWHIESRSTGQTLVKLLTIDTAHYAIENSALHW